MITREFKIRNLCKDRVLIQKNRAFNGDGEITELKPHLYPFHNSEKQRVALEENGVIPQVIKDAVFAMWGDTPTVEDPQLQQHGFADTDKLVDIDELEKQSENHEKYA